MSYFLCRVFDTVEDAMNVECEPVAETVAPTIDLAKQLMDTEVAQIDGVWDGEWDTHREFLDYLHMRRFTLPGRPEQERGIAVISPRYGDDIE